MATQFQKLAGKVTSLFGKESQSSDSKLPLLTKVAIVGGSIGALMIISLIPITISRKQEIKINKSSTNVYKYLAESDPTLLWPTLHPSITAASVKKTKSKKKQTLTVSARINGSPIIYQLNIKRNPTSKTIVMDSLLPIFYGITFNAKLRIVDKSRKTCEYHEHINVRLPIFLAIFGTNGYWSNTIPAAIKSGVENDW